MTRHVKNETATKNFFFKQTREGCGLEYQMLRLDGKLNFDGTFSFFTSTDKDYQSLVVNKKVKRDADDMPPMTEPNIITPEVQCVRERS